MSRVQARLGVVAVVALTLVLAGAPSAAAAPFSQAPSVVSSFDWLAAAAAWFGDLLGGFGAIVPTGKAPQAPASVTDPFIAGGGNGGGGNYRPNTGSCIDPEGCGV